MQKGHGQSSCVKDTSYKKQTYGLQIFTAMNNLIHTSNSPECTQWPTLTKQASAVSGHVFMRQKHLHPFSPLTQIMGVSNPFPFYCSLKKVLKSPTPWTWSQSRRKCPLQLFISHMPLPSAFFGFATDSTEIKRKTCRYALFCSFWQSLKVTLHATFSFVRLLPKIRLQFLFASHILRTTAPLFKLPCLWECYLSFSI